MDTEPVCTCRPGETVAGTRQEVIEQHLAQIFGLTVPKVHALLDLLDRTLETVLGIPENERAEDFGETARMMAAASGRTEGWILNFLSTWEFFSGEVERGAPYVLPPLGTDPRFQRDQ